jgi:hypothetical protein
MGLSINARNNDYSIYDVFGRPDYAPYITNRPDGLITEDDVLAMLYKGQRNKVDNLILKLQNDRRFNDVERVKNMVKHYDSWRRAMFVANK